MVRSGTGWRVPLLVLTLTLSSAAVAQPQPLDFDRDVRPILSEHCYECHGPSGSDETDLRLDGFAGATRDLGGYQALVPGKPAESELLSRVRATAKDERMPPGDRAPLTPRQIATLEAWISTGGEYRLHWAFVPPKAPALPKVKDPGWVRNPIDRFVLARLEQAGSRPSPEANRATLIRRASLALTGLPPTLEEIDAFLASDRADAYEDLVDRLLASPRYGEHQARPWLDAVRYGDTHGLHYDNERSVWPYRDWVVRSLNTDQPYDQFVIEQLAGDLLESPTADQLVATAYVRMNPTTNAGGSLVEEVQAQNTFDRVETAATVFMGLTMTCARCHDHKYDPISQRDYYGLFAFFNSTADDPLDQNVLLPAPVAPAASASQTEALAALRARLASAEGTVVAARAKAWLVANPVTSLEVGPWEQSERYPTRSFVETLDRVFPPERGWKSEWRTLGEHSPTEGFELDNGILEATYVRTRLVVKEPRTVELRLGSDDAVRVWLNGDVVHDSRRVRVLTPGEDRVSLALRAGQNALLLKVTSLRSSHHLHVEWVDRRFDAQSSTDPGVLRRAYLEFGTSGRSPDYRRALAALREIEAGIPSVPIARELEAARPAHVLHRGRYDQPREGVTRSLPAALGGTPPNMRLDRLGLARWLVGPQNALGARVFVNRVWQDQLGRGLVATPEDFGRRGAAPSHPGLLEWLAVTFAKSGWRRKQLHRLIVTSASFRQDAAATQRLRSSDPENRLLGRGPRHRLSAEVIRDQALYVSGLLVERLGGRGTRPYQPPGLWSLVGHTLSATRRFVQDRDDGLYRRSLYTFWKRSAPPPSMRSFDAPTRQTCVVRRSTTNTPLQALVTLNDPQFVEAARRLAARVLTTPGTNVSRLVNAFRRTTGRRPAPDELEILSETLSAARAHYEEHLPDASKLLRVGRAERRVLPVLEHAAWTVVCSTLLNLDETLTQH